MVTDHSVNAIRLPRDVATCSTCGGMLWLEVEEWEAGTGLPTDGGVIVSCTRSYHDGAMETRMPYVYWLPLRERALAWAREHVRVGEGGALTLVEVCDMPEAVNSPDHYTAGGIETIDYLRAKLTEDEYRGFLLGNALKYLSRAGRKGDATTDLEKARWYVDKAIALAREG